MKIPMSKLEVVPGEKRNFYAIRIGEKILAFPEDQYDEEAEKMLFHITVLLNRDRRDGFGPLAAIG